MAADNDIDIEHLKRELAFANHNLVFAKQENMKLQGIIDTIKQHMEYLHKDKEQSMAYITECERKIKDLQNNDDLSRKNLQCLTTKYEEEQAKSNKLEAELSQFKVPDVAISSVSTSSKVGVVNLPDRVVPLRHHVDVQNATKQELVRYIESLQNENKELKTTIHWQTKSKNITSKYDSQSDDVPKRRPRVRTLSGGLEEGKFMPNSDEKVNPLLEGNLFPTVQNLFAKIEVLNKKMVWNKTQFARNFAKARHPREPNAYSEQAQAMVCISCGGISSRQLIQQTRPNHDQLLLQNHSNNRSYIQQATSNVNTNRDSQRPREVAFLNPLPLQPDIVESTQSTTNSRHKQLHTSPLSLNPQCSMPPTIMQNIANFTLQTYLTPRSNTIYSPVSNPTENDEDDEDDFENVHMNELGKEKVE